MPESGRSPAGSGSGVLSPMRMISMSGNAATVAPCGCLAHSACVRAMPPAPFAAMIASSRSAAFQVATARTTASRSSATPSTLSAAAR